MSSLQVYWFFILLAQICCWAPLVNFSLQLLYFSTLEYLCSTFYIYFLFIDTIVGETLFAYFNFLDTIFFCSSIFFKDNYSTWFKVCLVSPASVFPWGPFQLQFQLMFSYCSVTVMCVWMGHTFQFICMSCDFFLLKLDILNKVAALEIRLLPPQDLLLWLFGGGAIVKVCSKTLLN